MKWFKHISAARNDERIARLEDRAGLEGYGFYFKMLEIVAEVMDSTDRHEATYSLTRWGRQANITSKKFLFLSQCCTDVGLMIVRRGGDDITVKIPNLLKYRDNHTKNLQVACKQEVEVEVDKEEKKIEKKQEQKAKPPASRSAVVFPPDIPDQLQTDFLALRKAKRAPLTQTALEGIAREAEKAGVSLKSALEMCCKRGWQGFEADWLKSGNRPNGHGNRLSPAGEASRQGAEEWLRQEGVTA